jgi:hypothetical protein
LNEGSFATVRGQYALSTPMMEVVIAQAVGSFRSALKGIADFLKTAGKHAHIAQSSTVGCFS